MQKPLLSTSFVQMHHHWLFVLLTLLLVARTAYAQVPPCDADTIKAPLNNTVHEPATYPGGAKAMNDFLSMNIQFVEELDMCGTVYIIYHIDAEGQVGDVCVERSRCPMVEAEIARVLKRMPQWTPAKHNGVAVRVREMLPMRFALD